MAKARFNLIENEDKATTISQATQPLQIPSFGFDDPDVLEDRFRDKGRYGILLANVIHRLKIIEVNRMNKFLMFARYSGTYRNARVCAGRDPLPHHVKRSHQITGDIVMPSVVTT